MYSVILWKFDCRCLYKRNKPICGCDFIADTATQCLVQYIVWGRDVSFAGLYKHCMPNDIDLWPDVAAILRTNGFLGYRDFIVWYTAVLYDFSMKWSKMQVFWHISFSCTAYISEDMPFPYHYAPGDFSFKSIVLQVLLWFCQGFFSVLHWYYISILITFYKLFFIWLDVFEWA